MQGPQGGVSTLHSILLRAIINGDYVSRYSQTPRLFGRHTPSFIDRGDDDHSQ